MTTSAPSTILFRHNTDLEPPQDYVDSLPRLKAVLRNQTLVETFEGYDRIADEKQRTLRWTGMASVWLGAIGLIGITTKLLMAALGAPHADPLQRLKPVDVVGFVSEAFLLGSIGLAIGSWIARTRASWLAARFMTERIRQWQFQLFLDGALMARAKSAPKAFEAERSRRWASFLSIAPGAEGAMNAFIDAQDLDLFHPVTHGDDPKTDEEVCRAYRDLRFQKQQAYFQHAREQFTAKDELWGAIAKWTLFTAILIAAAQLTVFALERSGRSVPHTLTIWMSAGALALVVVSLSVRVYRSAMGLSEQRERYESKFVRLVALRAAFEAAPTMTAKRVIMNEVERVETEELREFLRYMRKSSFVL
jgi:hypothetical protein